MNFVVPRPNNVCQQQYAQCIKMFKHFLRTLRILVNIVCRRPYLKPMCANATAGLIHNRSPGKCSTHTKWSGNSSARVRMHAASRSISEARVVSCCCSYTALYTLLFTAWKRVQSASQQSVHSVSGAPALMRQSAAGCCTCAQA
jgi:hypothetical protein